MDASARICSPAPATCICWERSAAIQRMRVCIKHHNESVGTQNTDTGGYHETITIAWIKLLGGLLRESGAMERAAFAQLAVERFAERPRDLSRGITTFDLVKSVEARRTWIPPDLASVRLRSWQSSL